MMMDVDDQKPIFRARDEAAVILIGPNPDESGSDGEDMKVGVNEKSYQLIILFQ
jgi:hypothetical protein